MKQRWWHKSVVYQIYPKSFNDSNGDGIGDIDGIIEKLDYLKELGIEVIWLSPIYKSPMEDNGYDISDYYEIAPEFGTMEDFHRLIKESDKRQIKIVMDLVVNHTSDEHPWFLESKSSLDNPKRDWYIWKDPKPDGGVPNNWESHFTRNAWEYDPLTEQYYMHRFSVKQPDLNWANRDLRHEIYKMMHFWLKKGIGGFRMDVINLIGKPSDFPDAALIDRGDLGSEHFINNSITHEYLREMHREVLCYYDILTVGETPSVSPYEGMLYSHENRNELGMIFQFEHMELDRNGIDQPKKLFDLVAFKKIMGRWQTELHGNGWNSNYWSNHDQARAVSRYGHEGKYRVESAKMLGSLLHMMSGTPYIYQGEEIGTLNTYYDSIDEYNDIMDHHHYDLLVNDYGCSDEEAMTLIRPFSRDNARVPINWSNKPNEGFTSGIPWLKQSNLTKDITVDCALEDKDSIFYHYQKLIYLRQESEYSNVIVYGKYQVIDLDDEKVYAYIRKDCEKKLLVIANFSDQSIIRQYPYKVKRVVLGNYLRNGAMETEVDLEDKVDLRQLNLSPYEALIMEIY